MKNLENKKIIIATHVYTTGPAQDFEQYLLNHKVGKLLFIGHPLFYDKNLAGSGYEVYRKGELETKIHRKIRKHSTIGICLKDIFFNIFWSIRAGKSWDLFVGSDNLNAFSGVVLKWLGIVDRVVYYVIDYNPYRFDEGLLNKIYHWGDHFCLRHADEVWNLSPRMEAARKKYFEVESKNQRVVPVGVWTSRINLPEFSQVEKHTLVFMGHITQKQGVQHVIEAIPDILKQIPDFKLRIIGGGYFLDDLKGQAKRLEVQKQVDFVGFVKRHEDIEAMLSRCSLSIAMYDKYDEKGNLSFTYFADPSKIKTYLACGLPVLLSDVSYNAS